MSDLALEPSERGMDGCNPADADPAPRRLVGIALVGLALEIGLRGGVDNAVVVAGLILVVNALIMDGRVRRREARLMALSAVALSRS